VAKPRRQFAVLIVLGGLIAAGLCAVPSPAAFNRTPAAAALLATAQSTARCVNVSVTDSNGDAVSGGYVSVTLTPGGGSTMTSYGLALNGSYRACFGGNGALPPGVTVNGYVDSNGNGAKDAGELTISGTA
jgi:hypothetical protein